MPQVGALVDTNQIGTDQGQSCIVGPSCLVGWNQLSLWQLFQYGYPQQGQRRQE